MFEQNLTYICHNDQKHVTPYCLTLYIITMNKAQLIGAIAEKSGLSKVDAKKALDAFLCSIADTMKKGDKVALVGFGTFSVVKKTARKGINPATRKPITIPAKKVVKFKAGSDLSAGL